MMLVVLLSGCRSHKRIVSGIDGPNPEQARFEQVVSNTYKYDALQSKSRYSLASTSLGGKLCLESGRRLCIQVNAPMIGFEVARVEASQEQVVIVDKFDKMYSVVQLADLYHLDELSGHEMEALESIILGRIYIPGIGQATKRDYRQLVWNTAAKGDGTFGNSVGTYQGKNYTLAYTVNSFGRLVSTELLVGNRRMLLEYSDYSEVESGKWVPTHEVVTATDGDGKNITLGIQLTSPELGESTWRDFEPTSSYQQVPVSQLVERIQSIGR